jgi:hypothetical protein
MLVLKASTTDGQVWWPFCVALETNALLVVFKHLIERLPDCAQRTDSE